MDSQQYSQTLSPNSNGRRLQWLPMGNATQANEGDEGGLNLGQVLGTLRRRFFVIVGVTTLVTSAAFLKALTSTPTYQSDFEILTNPVTAENQVISSVPQTISGKQNQTADTGIVDQTKLKVLKSPQLLTPIVNKLKKQYPNLTYDLLFAELTVTPTPNSQILAVSYTHKDQEQVKAVLDLVSKEYLDYSLRERLADVNKGLKFVKQQIREIEKQFEEKQDELEVFRQRHNLIEPESRGRALSDQVSTFENMGLENEVKLGELRTLYQELQRQLRQNPNGTAAASSLTEDPRYQKVVEKILELEAQLATESTLFKEGTPNIQVLEDQKQKLFSLLNREGSRVEEGLASRIRELQSRERLLNETKDLLNRRVKQHSVISRQYDDLQRELQIAAKNLEQFQTKQAALEIDAGQRERPWQLLTHPRTPEPSAVNLKRTVMLGAILGALLGVGVALFIDKLNNLLHDLEEVKDLTRLPLLGAIPFNNNLEKVEQLTFVPDLNSLVQQARQKLKLGSEARSERYGVLPFLESFRILYTNIRLLSPDAPIRSLTISSSDPAEGKSTVATYLAQAAAGMGQRVLLVDTDLRRPQVHEKMGLLNLKGLSDLVTADLELNQVIHRSPLEENLYVVTAGRVPPDPVKLLSSKKMQMLMQQFTDNFDLVIYDSPPLLGLADANLISAKTDGLVLVVGLGKANRSNLNRTLEGLKISPTVILGVVANGLQGYTDASQRFYYSTYTSPPLQQESADTASKSSLIK
jgi:capsular exopolysaccharide synthesis family protein